MFPLLDKSDFDGCNNSYTEESTRRTLSLLDLYGFENLEMNHLEQLCINYANERLHQVYLQNLKLYREEFGKFGSYQEKSSSRLPPLELDKIENESMERMDSMNSVLFNLLNEVRELLTYYKNALNRSPCPATDILPWILSL